MIKPYLLLNLFLLVGCGGTTDHRGHFTPSSSSSKNQIGEVTKEQTGTQIPVFLTSHLEPDVQHLWVKLYSVELLTGQGITHPFQNQGGEWIDLAALKNENPLSMYLGNGNLPMHQTIKRVLIALDRQYYIQNQNKKWQQKEFKASENDRKGYHMVGVTLTPHDKVSPSEPLTLQLQIKQPYENYLELSHLYMSVAHPKPLTNPDRQIPAFLSGTTSTVAGMGSHLHFTLNTNENQHVRITANTQTKLFNDQGETNLVVSNHQLLMLQGKYHPSQNAMIPDWVRILPKKLTETAMIYGILKEFKLGTPTLLVEPCIQSGFHPSAGMVKVKFADHFIAINTKGIKISESELIKTLKTPAQILIEGTFDAKEHLFMASWIKID